MFLEPKGSRRSAQRYFFLSLLTVVLTRLALATISPLADTTESRYGEIARLTLEQGFWLMPHITPTDPFWAKPPLSTWLAAGSAGIFGLSEFALRLPSFLMMMAVAWVIYRFTTSQSTVASVRHEQDQFRRAGWIAIFLFSASPLGFITAGTIMTDSAHVLCVTLALYLAWCWIQDPYNIKAKYGFYAVCGVGLLAKGIATLVLIGLPLCFYIILSTQRRQLFVRFLGLRGIAIGLAVALPWYLAAEAYSPGFLRYFIIGEHFSRFLDPGWQGDKFGEAHTEPRGFIWVYWIAAILPWLPIFLSAMLHSWKSHVARSEQDKFLWCAVLAPLLFFTFSGNILWTYCLTALPFAAILMANRVTKFSQKQRCWVALPSLLLALALIPTVTVVAYKESLQNSDRDMVLAYEAWIKQNTAGSSAQKDLGARVLKVAYEPHYSTYFYLKRKVEVVSLDQISGDIFVPGEVIAVAKVNLKQKQASDSRWQLPEHRVIYENRRSRLIELTAK